MDTVNMTESTNEINSQVDASENWLPFVAVAVAVSVSVAVAVSVGLFVFVCRCRRRGCVVVEF